METESGFQEIFDGFAMLKDYSQDSQTIKELLAQNLPEEKFWSQALKISKTVTFYLMREKYKGADKETFDKILWKYQLTKFALYSQFLMPLEVGLAKINFNRLKKELIAKGLTEEQWIQETAKTHMYHTQEWIAETYRDKDYFRFKYLCGLIGWEVDEFFPLLRKIANESRKIPSTDRSTKGYGGVI